MSTVILDKSMSVGGFIAAPRDDTGHELGVGGGRQPRVERLGRFTCDTASWTETMAGQKTFAGENRGEDG